MINVDNFTEKAKALIAYLKESFSQEELFELGKALDDNSIETIIPPEKVFGKTIDDISQEDALADALSDKQDSISVEPAPMNIDSSQPETITVDNPGLVSFEDAPKFRIYWRAWKEGNSTSGQTESNLETAQMARAEAMTKLYDLGFTDLEILAIETIKSVEQPESQI